MNASKDRIINVPMTEEDVSKTVTSLPRTEDTSKIVAVKWKRKLDMVNSHMEEYIRPAKCIEAVKKLKAMGNPFYVNINVDKNFHKKQT